MQYPFFHYRYHAYRQRPDIGTVLMCVPEPGNVHDPYAVAIKDSMNNIIGHVPRNICNVVSIAMNVHHILLRAHAIYIGGTISEGPVRGGGVKLPCIYLLDFRDFNGLLRASDILKNYIPDDCLCL